MDGVAVEANHVAKHPGCLVEGAVTVIVTVAVLLQEVILDDLSNLQSDLVSFIETRLEGIACIVSKYRPFDLVHAIRYLANKLHNFRQVLFHLQNFPASITEGDILRVGVFIVGFEHLHILGVTQVPVNRGELLALSKLLIETPEDLDDTESSSSNGIRKVTTRWGYARDHVSF